MLRENVNIPIKPYFYVCGSFLFFEACDDNVAASGVFLFLFLFSKTNSWLRGRSGEAKRGQSTFFFVFFVGGEGEILGSEVTFVTHPK